MSLRHPVPSNKYLGWCWELVSPILPPSSWHFNSKQRSIPASNWLRICVSWEVVSPILSPHKNLPGDGRIVTPQFPYCFFWKLRTHIPALMYEVAVFFRKRATKYNVRLTNRIPAYQNHSQTKPLFVGLFCGKWPIQIRDPMVFATMKLWTIWCFGCSGEWWFFWVFCSNSHTRIPKETPFSNKNKIPFSSDLMITWISRTIWFVIM